MSAETYQRSVGSVGSVGSDEHVAHGSTSAEDALGWERVELGIADEELQEAKVDGDGHAPVEGHGAGDTHEVDTLADGEAGEGAATETYTEADGGATPEEVEGHLPPEETLIDHEPEIVHGRDDRVRVGDTRPFPWRAICHLRITTATGGTALCTGALIGPRVVLTAGHCLYMHGAGGGWARRIVVTPGRNGGSEPHGTATSSHFISTKGWVEDKSYNYDYGVIILPKDQALGRRTGWFGLASLSFASLLGLRINSSGYPGDKPSGTQWWNANNVLAVTARRIYYRVDTMGGQSGSPDWRFKDGNRHIVAVHNTGGSPFNGGVRITKAVFDNLVDWKKTYA